MRYHLTGAAAAALIAVCAAAPAAAAVVNVDALSGAGTTVALGAGTYSVSYAGLAGGGNYDAFNFWGQVTGCNSQGSGCGRGWTNSFAIDFGGGVGTAYGLATVGGVRQLFDTAAHAFAVYSTSTLQSATLAQVGTNANYFHQGTNAYVDVAQPITFTLASAQNVRFFVLDTNYPDNLGGVSLQLASVPEPSAWALLIAGFGAVGAGMRRRGKRAVASVSGVLRTV